MNLELAKAVRQTLIWKEPLTTKPGWSLLMAGVQLGSGDATFADTFEHKVQSAHVTRLYYVIGGHGDPVLLVPGWPQTWYSRRRVMPAVAQNYTVLAVDPRGLVDSDKPADGYDTATISARLRELTEVLRWDRLHFVGHDIGCRIGYPFAATCPSKVRKLVVIDATVPGVVKTCTCFFSHFAICPRHWSQAGERAFLAWLFQSKTAKPAAIDKAALDEYVRCY